MEKKLLPLILHAAFTMAVPVYFFIYQFILLPQNPPVANDRTLLVYAVFLSLALGALALALHLPARLPQLQRRASDAPELRRARVMQATVLQGALLESIAIYGLIGLFLDLLPWMSQSLLALGLLALLAFTPRVRAWAEEMK